MGMLIVLPEQDDRREYGPSGNILVAAPDDMDLATALAIIDQVIYRANKEDYDAVQVGGDGCEDGLVVEDSIKRRLTALGFTFPAFVESTVWDAYIPENPDPLFAEKFDESWLQRTIAKKPAPGQG